MESLIKDFKVNINTTYTDFISNIHEIINEKENSITKLNAEISEYKIKLKTLTRQYNLLNEECENFQKVSIVKNLNTQLFEKENIIKFLNKKIETLKNQNIKMDINDVKSTVNSSTSTSTNNNSKASGKVEASNNNGIKDVEDIDVDDDGENEEIDDGDGDSENEEIEDGDGEQAENEDNEKADGEQDEKENGEQVGEVDENSEEIEEVEFYEKKLKSPTTKKMMIYYITDDANKEIYEKLEEDEIGECIGKLVGKNNKPHFY